MSVALKHNVQKSVGYLSHQDSVTADLSGNKSWSALCHLASCNAKLVLRRQRDSHRRMNLTMFLLAGVWYALSMSRVEDRRIEAIGKTNEQCI